jgi:hypothetical protein
MASDELDLMVEEVDGPGFHITDVLEIGFAPVCE